jgi:threonine aldolase
MLMSMNRAMVGDDVFRDDPTVNKLEAMTADLLGKEAAMFVTTGTLSNQIAMRLHVGPLQEVLCDHRAHIHVWEVGGIHATGAAVAAVKPEPGESFLTAESVMANARTDNCLYHQPVTKLLSLENTLNGDVMPMEQLEAAVSTARDLGLSAHLDGARLWNACAASGHTPAEYAAPFDTVSVCLSKGLGAPVGSVLVGSEDHIEEARHYRKMLGGGWRQAGVLAAAGIYALENHRERLVDDHAAASDLADGLVKLGFDVQPPKTNMVWCGPPPIEGTGLRSYDELFLRLQREAGILVGGAYGGPAGRQPWGEAAKAMRFVTHMHTPRMTGVPALLNGLAKLLKRAL